MSICPMDFDGFHAPGAHGAVLESPSPCQPLPPRASSAESRHPHGTVGNRGIPLPPTLPWGCWLSAGGPCSTYGPRPTPPNGISAKICSNICVKICVNICVKICVQICVKISVKMCVETHVSECFKTCVDALYRVALG